MATATLDPQTDQSDEISFRPAAAPAASDEISFRPAKAAPAATPASAPEPPPAPVATSAPPAPTDAPTDRVEPTDEPGPNEVAGSNGMYPVPPERPEVEMHAPSLFGVNIPQGSQEQLEHGLRDSYSQNPGPVVSTGKAVVGAAGELGSGLKDVYTPTDAEQRSGSFSVKNPTDIPGAPMSDQESTHAKRKAIGGLAKVLAGGGQVGLVLGAPELTGMAAAAATGDTVAIAALARIGASVGIGTGAQWGAGKAADKLNLSPEAKALAQQAAFWAAAGLSGYATKIEATKGEYGAKGFKASAPGVDADISFRPAYRKPSPEGGYGEGSTIEPGKVQAGVTVGRRRFGTSPDGVDFRPVAPKPAPKLLVEGSKEVQTAPPAVPPEVTPEGRAAGQATADHPDMKPGMEQATNQHQPIGEEVDGRTVVQPTDNPAINQALATSAMPEFEKGLKTAIKDVPGASIEASREEKNPKRLAEKINGEDKPAATIGDYGAMQVKVDSPEAKDAAVAAIKKAYPVISEDDKFEDGDDDYGYRNHSLQVQTPNGSSMEVQVVPKEVMEANADEHGNYKAAREAKISGNETEFARQAGEAKTKNDKAMEAFNARNEVETKLEDHESRISEPLDLYHGTAAAHSESIEKHGLKAGPGTGGQVFLTHDLKEAQTHAAKSAYIKKEKGKGVIYKTTLPAGTVVTKFPDAVGGFVSTGEIPAARLSRHEDAPQEVAQKPNSEKEGGRGESPEQAAGGGLESAPATKTSPLASTDGEKWEVAKITKGSKVRLKDGTVGTVNYYPWDPKGKARVTTADGRRLPSVPISEMTAVPDEDEAHVDLAPIGAPLTARTDQIKAEIAKGTDVRIFSARVADDPQGEAGAEIEEWSEKNLGKKLPVTNAKDDDLAHILDDKANVEPNANTPFEIPAIPKGKWLGVDLDKTLAEERPQPAEVEAKTKEGGPTAGSVSRVPLSDLRVDPKRFQYKLNADNSGATGKLKEVPWNDALSGIITVWRDPADGNSYVINGHHRYDLAERHSAPNLAVRMLDESVKTAAQARTIGALQNIAEGQGTAIDAAKFLRDSGLSTDDLSKYGISLSGPIAEGGTALSLLDQKFFDDVVAGRIPERRGIAIAKAAPTPAQQEALVKLIGKAEAKGKTVTNATIEELGRMVNSAEEHTSTQDSLFGSQERTQNLAFEKAEVSAYLRNQLGQEKKLFAGLSNKAKAEKVSAVGENRIDAEENKGVASRAQQAQEIYDRLSVRKGPVDDILNHAAKRIAEGDNANTVKSEAYRSIRTALSEALRGGQEGSADRVQKDNAGPETGKQKDIESSPPQTSKSSKPTAADLAADLRAKGKDVKTAAELDEEQKPSKKDLEDAGQKPMFARGTPTWYLKSEKLIDQKMKGPMTGEQVQRMLENGGVKADELKWTGLADFLKGKFRVTPEQVRQHLADGGIQIKEVTKGTGRPYDALRDGPFNGDALWEPEGAAKYREYQLPGGENYREMLLTMPDKANRYRLDELHYDEVESDRRKMWVIDAPGQQFQIQRYRFDTPEEAMKYISAEKTRSDKSPPFQSSHWEEPGVLAHIRFNDRTTPDGKKLLHLEELQSDWHQKGRNTGYKSSDSLAQEPFGAVPDAPFKKDWHEMAFRRMVRYAAENGYDGVSWTPGEKQAERYDLSKKVQQIDYTQDNRLMVRDKNNSLIHNAIVEPEKLPEVIGKEAAQKLLDTTPRNHSGLGSAFEKSRTLYPDDLKLGGEGMKGFYDKIIPDYARKFGKQWGATVENQGIKTNELPRYEGPSLNPNELRDLSVKPDSPEEAQAVAVRSAMRRGVSFEAAMQMHNAEQLAKVLGGRFTDASTKVPYLEITPEMRKAVTTEGVPMFQRGDALEDGRRQGRFFSVPAEGGDAPLVHLDGNVRDALNELEPELADGGRWVAVSLPKAFVDKLVQKLRLKATPNAVALAGTIDRSRDAGGNTILLTPSGASSASEEQFHSFQHRQGSELGDVILQIGQSPEVLKAQKYLKKQGYSGSLAEAAQEASAKTFNGDWAGAGLTRDEGATLLNEFLDAVVKVRGKDALTDLPKITDEISDVIEEVYERHQVPKRERSGPTPEEGDALAAKSDKDGSESLRGESPGSAPGSDQQGAQGSLFRRGDDGKVRMKKGDEGHPVDYVKVGGNPPKEWMSKLGPSELYHQTTRANAEAILRDGYDASKPQRVKGLNVTQDPNAGIHLKDTATQKWPLREDDDVNVAFRPIRPLRILDASPFESAREAARIAKEHGLDGFRNEDTNMRGKSKEYVQHVVFNPSDLTAHHIVEDIKPKFKRGDDATGERDESEPLSDLIDKLKGQKAPDSDLIDRFKKETQRSVDSLKAGASGVQKGLAGIKGIAAAAWNSYRRPPKWTDFKDATGKFQAAEQFADHAMNQFADEIKRVVPEKARREAMTNYVEAGGKASVLKERAAQTVDPKLRKGYELAAQLTSEEKSLAGHIREYLDTQLDQAVKLGMLEQGARNYITHIHEKDARGLQSLINFGELAPNPAFIKKRVFSSYFEGEQLGFMPRDKDIGYLTTAYHDAFTKALASRAYIASMLEGKAEDGRPLAILGSRGKWVQLNPDQAVSIIEQRKRPDNVVDYRTIDHPALRNWNWDLTDEDAAQVSPKLFEDPDKALAIEGDLLLHPEIADKVGNILGRSAIAANPIGKAALMVSSTMKQALLSFSGFHQTQEGVHALEHRILPATMPELNFDNPIDRALVEHGLVVADFDGQSSFSEGISGTELTRHIPIIGEKLHAYQNYLFRSYIPRLKMAMAKHALSRNQMRYKNKLTKDQILELTANQANAAFGGLNYKMMGRNKTFQDLLRLSLLAPDFLEARARFAGQATKPFGQEQRTALILGAMVFYAVARILNYVLNDGDMKLEPSMAFSVALKGRKIGLRTVQGDILRLVTDPRSFIFNRLNPMTVRPTVEYLTGRDQFGRQKRLSSQAKDYLKAAVPIPAQGYMNNVNENWAQSIENALGLETGTYRTPAEDEAYKQHLGNIPDKPEDDDKQDEGRLHKKLEDKLREGSMTSAQLWEMVGRGKPLTPHEAGRILKQSRNAPIQNYVKNLSIEQMIVVFEKANPEERDLLRPSLMHKRATELPNRRPAEREKIEAAFEKLRNEDSKLHASR